MVPKEPLRLVEIHGFLRIGPESWEGVGWWPEPKSEDAWCQLAADAAAAFSCSAATLFPASGGAIGFKANGSRVVAYPSQEMSVSRYLNKHKPADPDRVSWRPLVEVRIALGGEGGNHGEA